MGYLDGSSITVDAILTKHGRRLLAEGRGLCITKFALADDGIDYDLWNVNHPSGSDSYDDAITALPQVEAVPDDGALMRYKLDPEIPKDMVRERIAKGEDLGNGDLEPGPEKYISDRIVWFMPWDFAYDFKAKPTAGGEDPNLRHLRYTGLPDPDFFTTFPKKNIDR